MGASCPGFLAKVMENIENIQKTIIPEQLGDRVLRGSLLLFEDGATAFGLGPVILIPANGHRVIEALILRNEQKYQKDIKERWHGELKFENGALVAANETSGYMKSLGLSAENDIGAFKRFIKEYKLPFPVARNASFYGWSESSSAKKKHLDSTMSKFVDMEGERSFLHNFFNHIQTPVYAIARAKNGKRKSLSKYPEEWFAYKYIADLMHKEGYPFEKYTQVQRIMINIATENLSVVSAEDILTINSFNKEFVKYLEDAAIEKDLSWFFPLVKQVHFQH